MVCGPALYYVYGNQLVLFFVSPFINHNDWWYIIASNNCRWIFLGIFYYNDCRQHGPRYLLFCLRRIYYIGAISSHDVSTRMSLNLEVSNDFFDTSYYYYHCRTNILSVYYTNAEKYMSVKDYIILVITIIYVYCILLCYSFMRHVCFYFDIVYIIIDSIDIVYNIVTISYKKLLWFMTKTIIIPFGLDG